MAFTPITGGGVFTRQNLEQINDNFARLFAYVTTGNAIYCNPGATGTSTQDGSEDNPYTSLVQAYSATRSGKNDIVFLVGDGSTGASARPTSTLTLANNAAHIFGVGAPSNNTRARIATLSGNTAFASFVLVTGTGSLFANFSLFNDNAIANQITWTDAGGRNGYQGVNFGGMADATSAADAGSRILKLGATSGASGENLFLNCTFGLDTIARSAANATIEITTGSKRNVFRDCYFPSRCTAATPIHIKSSGTNPLETYQLFVNPVFWNQQANGSGTTMTGVATLAASGNGNVVLVNPARFNITDWGTDATSLAQVYVIGASAGATDDVGRGAVAIAT
jgi:hypothetical protein